MAVIAAISEKKKLTNLELSVNERELNKHNLVYQ